MNELIVSFKGRYKSSNPDLHMKYCSVEIYDSHIQMRFTTKGTLKWDISDRIQISCEEGQTKDIFQPHSLKIEMPETEQKIIIIVRDFNEACHIMKQYANYRNLRISKGESSGHDQELSIQIENDRNNQQLDADFEEHCVQYMSILNKQENLHSIIDKYIDITEENKLLDASNLNFLRKYLFKRKMTENVLLFTEVKSIVDRKVKDFDKNFLVISHRYANILNFEKTLEDVIFKYVELIPDRIYIHINFLRKYLFIRQLTPKMLDFNEMKILCDKSDKTMKRRAQIEEEKARIEEEKARVEEEKARYLANIQDTFNHNVNQLTDKLSQNKEVIQLIDNFVKISIENGTNILFNQDELLAFESILATETKKEHEYKNIVFGVFSAPENISCYESADGYLGSFKTVYRNSYFNEFEMLVKTIARKLALTNNVLNHWAIWLKLTYEAINIVAEKWDADFRHYFLDIEYIDLFDCIKKYCLIKEIDIQSEESIFRFVYYLISKGKFGKEIRIQDCIITVQNMLTEEFEIMALEQFEKKLLLSTINKPVYTIEDIDLMDGREFEQFVAELFRKMGFSTEVTKHSYDQGIDIIAEKNGMKIGIQAKCYSGSVGNSAIQEVATGKNHYRLDKAIVITNNFFTPAAIELANSNSVILWDRNILKEKLSI